MPNVTTIQGDCLEQLRTLSDESVHCCVTSPPYWGLRDYGVDGQIGLEATPQEYVAKLEAVFLEVRRVLRKDGTCWVNLGDSYARQAGDDSTKSTDTGFGPNGKTGRTGKSHLLFKSGNNIPPPGLKPKDLCGIPWRVAFALQADGWYLRSDIIWHKPNPMPESVTDRPTKAHEYLFLLAKSERYYYDAEAIKEPQSPGTFERFGNDGLRTGCGIKQTNSPNGLIRDKATCAKAILDGGRNKRSVWTVPTSPYAEAHFATFPPDLIKPCILAGCPVGGTVLDPFGGSGTTGMVALELGRNATLIELNPKYVQLIQDRTFVTPGLAL